ncbi:hypothetical protein I3760_10G123700 [Carya illinoinensis]|nr:hypothetical protein I3760_10G123700 [Carya illinoinensis]
MSTSLYVPPYFDGKNFAYWKVRMRAFLKSLDERVWHLVERGWTKPEISIDAWTKDEINNCNLNSKGLNAIFMAVSSEEFKRISMCEIAKEVWDILEVTHEGTRIVKNSKLQMLTSKFEETKMLEDENFNDFYAKLNDVVNSRFNLGEKLEDSKIVRKILRSLPERFQPKVTAIEESKDLDAIRVEELVGSLQTYESLLPQARKSKSIALKTIEENQDDFSDEENLNNEDIDLIVRKFRKFMFNKKYSGKKKGGREFSAKKNYFEKWNKEKSDKVKCHECSGYGHIRIECPNFKKSKGKALNVTLSDSLESETSSSSSDYDNTFVAFSTVVNDFSDIELTKFESDDDNSDSEVALVVDDHELSLQEAYNDVCEEVIKLKKLNKKLYKKFTNMESEKNNLSKAFKISDIEIARLRDQKIALEKELEKVQEKTATQKLEEMLSIQKSSCDRTGLGYMTSQGMELKDSSSAATSSKDIIFVKGSQDEETPKKVVSTTHVPRASHDRSMTKKPNQGKCKVKFIPICHYCGVVGHIRPNCFNLNKVKKNGCERNPKRKGNSLENQVCDMSQQINFVSLKIGEIADFCFQNKEKIIQSDVDKKNRPKFKAKLVVKDDAMSH